MARRFEIDDSTNTSQKMQLSIYWTIAFVKSDRDRICCVHPLNSMLQIQNHELALGFFISFQNANAVWFFHKIKNHALKGVVL
jgi:hypothetical protein